MHGERMKITKGSVSVFLVAGFLGIVGYYSVFRADSRAPKFSEQTLEFWLDELKQGGARSNAARSVVLNLGNKAAPLLAAQLSYDAPFRANLIDVKMRLPFVVATKLPRAPDIDWSR